MNSRHKLNISITSITTSTATTTTTGITVVMLFGLEEPKGIVEGNGRGESIHVSLHKACFLQTNNA